MPGLRDLHNNIKVSSAIDLADGQTGTVNGNGIDTRDFDSTEIVFQTGTTVDLTSIALEESDDDATYTAVDTTLDQLGADPGSYAADSVYKLGYVGNKRYVRGVAILASATDLGAIATQSHAHEAAVD